MCALGQKSFESHALDNELLRMRGQLKHSGREAEQQLWRFGKATRLTLDSQRNASSVLSRCVIRKDTISRPCSLYLKSKGDTYFPRLTGDPLGIRRSLALSRY